MFFLKHLGLETKFIFIGDKIPLFKQKKSDFNGLENLINFLPTKQPFAKIEADYKCCLVRDPLERFLSAFNNRILFHKDIAFMDNSIDMILEKLENNLFENKHFLPQNYFLGNNLDYFSFYTDVKNNKIFVRSGEILWCLWNPEKLDNFVKILWNSVVLMGFCVFYRGSSNVNFCVQTGCLFLKKSRLRREN